MYTHYPPATAMTASLYFLLRQKSSCAPTNLAFSSAHKLVRRHYDDYYYFIIDTTVMFHYSFGSPTHRGFRTRARVTYGY